MVLRYASLIYLPNHQLAVTDTGETMTPRSHRKPTGATGIAIHAWARLVRLGAPRHPERFLVRVLYIGWAEAANASERELI
jgi:hypothetical protein